MTYPVAAGQGFFIVARDGTATVPLCGPLPSHGQAAGLVDAVRARFPHDSRAHWASYGVALVNDAAGVRPLFAVADLEEDDAGAAERGTLRGDGGTEGEACGR